MAIDTILCVDDDSSVLGALRTLLNKGLNHALRVEIAESGEEALEIVAELHEEGSELTIVVADYIMPGMKGDELLVRVHEQLPDTVTIMLTGQSDMHGVKRAINEASLFRFIEKPWQNDDLILTLQAALRTYSLDRALREHVQKLQRMNETLEEIVAERTGKLVRKNEELERLSVTDRLTGLFNRLYLDRVMDREHAAAVRHSSQFSVILIDVDHFKRVNDTYGHQAGDEVLVTIAGILSDRTRDCDVAGRWGGEEFLIICPNTGLDGAMTAAEALRLGIERTQFPHVGMRTASFGVVEHVAGETVVEMLDRADKALYAAKSNGRNRVIAG